MKTATTQTNVQHANATSQTEVAREEARSALARLETGQRDAMEELRVALCTLVGALRRDGLSREATLESVRTFIATPVTTDGTRSLTPIVDEVHCKHDREASGETQEKPCPEHFEAPIRTSATVAALP